MEPAEFFILGEYPGKLDEQARLSIPADFRRALEEGGENELIFCPGPADSICVFPRKYYNWHQQSKDSHPTSLLETFHSDVSIFKNSFRRHTDKQGRVTLPPPALKRLGEERDVIFVGCQNYFVIWSKSGYAAYTKDKAIPPEEAWNQY